MKRLAQRLVAATVLTIPLAVSAQTLTEEQARAVIAAWYVVFNQPVQGDMKTLQEQVLTEDYESCWGYLPGECWGRDASIKVVGGFAKSIPDMKFDIKEVLVSGGRVIVRGEVSGTPAGDLFGVAHTGKSFRIMAIDIQTIRDGKIARTSRRREAPLTPCLSSAQSVDNAPGSPWIVVTVRVSSIASVNRARDNARGVAGVTLS